MTSLQMATLDEMREAAARICRDYLTGRWKEVTADQLVVKRITGGLSNMLYYISLPPEDTAEIPSAHIGNGTDITCADAKNNMDVVGSITRDSGISNKRQRTDSGCGLLTSMKQQQEPREVLLRVYGQTHGGDALEAMITESVVFALLSERNFGPKLHGIFPGGRIEQFLPARPLKTRELGDYRISMKIAEKMGEIHSLNIPMSKEPDWLWNSMNRWMNSVASILQRTDWKGHESQVEFVRGFDFTEETKWLKSLIAQHNCKVLFCHNDLQEGNILLKSANDDSNGHNNMLMQNNNNNNNNNDMDVDCAMEPELIIIDFEYCAYNYRGFDLANHFIEWAFDYTNPQYPHYYHLKQQYPTKEQRYNFIRTYLTKLHDSICDDDDQQQQQSDDGNDGDHQQRHYMPTQEELEEVDTEVAMFSMFSHLFWGLWSVVNVTSTIEFGYWDYAMARLNEYKQLKRQYINKT